MRIECGFGRARDDAMRIEAAPCRQRDSVPRSPGRWSVVRANPDMKERLQIPKTNLVSSDARLCMALGEEFG